MNIRKPYGILSLSDCYDQFAPWIPYGPLLTSCCTDQKVKLGPKIEEARNGMTVVNINTPNMRGSSHNQYNAFNVDEKGSLFLTRESPCEYRARVDISWKS